MLASSQTNRVQCQLYFLLASELHSPTVFGQELEIPIAHLYGTQGKGSLLFEHAILIQINSLFDAKLLS